MPLVRRIVKVGNARAVTLPKDWLDYWERQLREPIKEVGMQVNKKLIIEPFLPDRRV